MHYVKAKGILTANGGRHGMNIYRGCSHGCIYCDSRSKCYQFTHDFEDIEVKQNAPELLEEALRKKRKRIASRQGETMRQNGVPGAAQCNGCAGERRSSGMNETCRLRRGERYEACDGAEPRMGSS